ncbi:unnamed protein product [Zymoseptoria tritici ST99CH_3D7]|uniref:Uncharacterized protein n=2 Tax=Zymoseptoria tritici TaxID=1047171 RepID=A0A1X7S286_ZYMT9|nr:unnamed protein product [Zymoseptoria tritici ST99CH_3D7]SMR58237.1 unnamed protein product [Zymoseptoria tritici ST99CH_1E4]
MRHSATATKLQAAPAPGTELEPEQTIEKEQSPKSETIFAELKVNLDTAQTLRYKLEALENANAKRRTLVELGKDMNAAQAGQDQTNRSLEDARRAYSQAEGGKLNEWDLLLSFIGGLLIGAIIAWEAAKSRYGNQQ